MGLVSQKLRSKLEDCLPPLNFEQGQILFNTIETCGENRKKLTFDTYRWLSRYAETIAWLKRAMPQSFSDEKKTTRFLPQTKPANW